MSALDPNQAVKTENDAAAEALADPLPSWGEESVSAASTALDAAEVSGVPAVETAEVGATAPDASMESADAGATPYEASLDAAAKVGAAPEAGPVSLVPSLPEPSAAQLEIERLKVRPTYLFFAAVAGLGLAADVLSKAWAELTLSQRLAGESMVLIPNHLFFTLAYNQGGAWGLFQNADRAVRVPFFVVVSVGAIVFILSLYSRLGPHQRALTWGLPLVFGGALGNFTDRLVRGMVIDFIDYRADWVREMNLLILKIRPDWGVTDHWPTFNVADICICVGVGLMALDMLFGKRRQRVELAAVAPPAAAPTPSTPPGPAAP